MIELGQGGQVTDLAEVSHHRANIAAIVLVDAALARFLGWHGIAYLGLSTLFAHGLHSVAAHFIHEHYIYSPGQETYSYYGILNRLTFNVGYHHEHHDFVAIPGSRLPAYRKLTAYRYDHLVSHRSWTWVLWHFVTSRELGPHSRMVRSAAAATAQTAIVPLGLSSASKRPITSY